jgi:uncharacterized membrane protein
VNKDQLLQAALAAIIGAASVSAQAQTAVADNARVKCYGVAQAGQNDCGTATHSCAGKAAVDRDPAEWKYALAKKCKAEGGSLTALAGAKPTDSSSAKSGDMSKSAMTEEKKAEKPKKRKPKATEQQKMQEKPMTDAPVKAM